MYAKDKITLEGEDKEIFDRLYNILEDIEDVSQIYTNVSKYRLIWKKKKKNNIWLLIAKVALIFLVFEVFTKVLGGLIASKLYSSLLNGKYIIYAVSEFVVFVFAIILLIIKKNGIYLKKRKLILKML